MNFAELDAMLIEIRKRGNATVVTGSASPAAVPEPSIKAPDGSLTIQQPDINKTSAPAEGSENDDEEGECSGTQAIAASQSAVQYASPAVSPTSPVPPVIPRIMKSGGESGAGYSSHSSERPRYRWEYKRGDLTPAEKLAARAALAGVRRERNCFFCHKAVDLHILHSGMVDIHHELPQGSPERNFLEHLHLAHHGENLRDGTPPRTVAILHGREREKTSPAPTRGIWTSEEGRRNERMKWFYKQKLFNPKDGLMVGLGTKKPLKQFAAELADWKGEGEAQSYQRYLENDALVGYFVITTAAGIDWIERTGKKYPLERLGLKPEEDSLDLKVSKEAQA